MRSCGARPVRPSTVCSAGAVAALLLYGCGGISAGTPDGGAPPSPDAGAAVDAGAVDATARADAAAGPDAGAAIDVGDLDAVNSLDAAASVDAVADAIIVSGIPVDHRPSPAICPQQRAAG